MIADKVNFSDGFGPRGYVILKDTKTGQIIFKGHNMITRAGKEYIFYTFLANALGKSGPGAIDVTDARDGDAVKTAFENENNLSEYRLAKCVFGSDNSATSYEALSLSSPIENYVFLIRNNSNITYEAHINTKTGENYLQFHINGIKGNSTTLFVSELGLYLSKDTTSTTINNNTDFMFSRIAFDPVPFTDNNEFSLDYYIYF